MKDYEEFTRMFIKLYYQSLSVGGSRQTDHEKVLHYSNLLSFLLESGVCSHNVLSLMSRHWSEHPWITCRQMTEVIGLIYRPSSRCEIWSRRPSKEFECNGTMQRLLCEVYAVFFRCLADGKKLPAYKLHQVFVMSGQGNRKEAVRTALWEATLQMRLQTDHGVVSFKAFWAELMMMM
jgi:hypothetical protein